MIHRLFFIFLWLFLPRAFPESGMYRTDKGQVQFQSTAPLEMISASSTELSGLLDPAKNTFAFSIRMTSFSGFNSYLQGEHFNENYLESDKYPNASFSGKIIESMDYSIAGEYNIRAKGLFNIHGVEQERIIPVKLAIQSGSIQAISNFTVLLSDYNIKVPQILHDKLASDVKVHVEANLHR